MTISMNYRELRKLKADRKIKINSSRKKRTTLLSEKSKGKMFKKFDKEHEPESTNSNDVNIDVHVKMNDSYMRTGLYVPKKK
ncbi:MAG: hypothetical protein G3M70_16010 [Candidatus Nitronauta litoralis]|uniref:Uncharacterized protein n=1 Tax=Candidatus Nitronauta litoralis TaxID=2705533 RepID=A0A7T0BYI4_9BACT|nr:MAG: hypothetical protein G3M70_16010 [Candidatus Nitronauta litoralis]